MSKMYLSPSFQGILFRACDQNGSQYEQTAMQTDAN